MCWIQGAVPKVFFQPPHIVIAAFVKIEMHKIMDVSPLRVNDFTEITLACKVKRQQFEKIVATVFENDAMLLCVLGSFNKLPALFYSCGSRHFKANMFAA